MDAYRFSRGVRFRVGDDGAAMLLVPEGIVALNETAAAALELVDGRRDLDAIAAQLGERYDADPRALRDDVAALFDDLLERGLVVA